MGQTAHAPRPARLPRFHPYPEYKPSGIEWLGSIPAHWKLKRLKTVASVRLSNVDKHSRHGEVPVKLCNYVDVYYEDVIADESEFMEATATREQISRHTLRAGDVLITKDSESRTDIAVSAVVAKDFPNVVCGYHLAHIKPGSDLDGRFLSRQFPALGIRDQFHVAAKGITRFGLGAEAIRNSIFPVAPIDEQRAIAAFLDRETAKIDALVAKKERLVQLFQEKRATLITRVITQGLNSSAQMKNSGAKWLDEIPAHWEVMRLLHLTPPERPIMYGIVLPGPSVDVGVPIVKGGDVGVALTLDELSKTTFDIESRHARSRLQSGDLVYSIRGSIGDVGVVPDELEGCNLTQDAARIAYTGATDGSWLCYALQAKPAFCQLDAGALGATIKGVNIRDLKRVLLPVPPRSEQTQIAAFLDAQTEKLGKLSKEAAKAVEHLMELRTSLVSAAVTGKIDVREEVS